MTQVGCYLWSPSFLLACSGTSVFAISQGNGAHTGIECLQMHVLVCTCRGAIGIGGCTACARRHLWPVP